MKVNILRQMLPLCLQKGGRGRTIQQGLACLGHFFSLLMPCAGAGAPEGCSCCDASANHFCFLQGRRGWLVNISLKPCTTLDWIAKWLLWRGGLEAETLCACCYPCEILILTSVLFPCLQPQPKCCVLEWA